MLIYSAVKKMRPELKIVSAGIIIWAVGLLMGLPVIPVRFTQIILSTYIVPVFTILLVQLFILVLSRLLKLKKTSSYVLLWGLPLFLISVYLYYQFKSWAPLINHREYDQLYQNIDNHLWFIRDNLISFRILLSSIVKISLDQIYYTLFLLIFLISLTVYGIKGTILQQRRLMIGLSSALIIGGLMHWIAPAAGPFIYRSLAGQELAAAQMQMLDMYRSIRASRVIPADYFGAALGAMPSMHFAFVIFFLLFTKEIKWLFLIFALIFCWFLMDSVYLGWHYLIDIVGGAAVALPAYYLSKYWVR